MDTGPLAPAGCIVVRQAGLWTDFMRDVPARTSYVALMMDDVDVSSVHMSTFMGAVQQYSLDVAAPSIANEWYWKVMEATPEARGCAVRKTLFVDMLFTVFTQAPRRPAAPPPHDRPAAALQPAYLPHMGMASS